MNPQDNSILSEKAQLRQKYENSRQSPLPPPPAEDDESAMMGYSSVPIVVEEHEQQHLTPLSVPGSGSGSGSASASASASMSLAMDMAATTRSPTPPPYSGPSSPSQASSLAATRAAAAGPQKFPGLPRLDYRLYQPPLFDLSGDKTTIKSTAPYLSASASALASLVRAQSAVPPKQLILVTGKRDSKVDFSIRMNLMSLLVPEDGKQRMDYIRCVGPGEVALRGGLKPSAEPEVGDGGLDEWARRFVEDGARVKSFALERVVANLDVEWLEGQLRSLVAATAYKGVVTVTFPVTHARVVVQSPDRVNKFFTSVTTLFAGKHRYEVVQAVWPFATHRNGEPGRRCAVQSEDTWWREWKDPIKYAVITRRQGWVTNEDKLEALMEGAGKGVSAVDWGPNPEHAQ